MMFFKKERSVITNGKDKKMSEEKRMILEMLKDGKITVEEAEQLLEKANPGESIKDAPQIKKPNSKKFLRVRVTEEDKVKANVNIPIALAEVGLNLIPKSKLKVDGKQINMDDILKLIEEGTEGELVNIDAEDEGKNYKVNIFID
jgi:SHOCT-like protein